MNPTFEASLVLANWASVKNTLRMARPKMLPARAPERSNFRGMGKPGLEGSHKRLDKAGPHALTARSGTGADDSAKVVIKGNAEVPVSQPLPHILFDVEVIDEEHHVHHRRSPCL